MGTATRLRWCTALLAISAVAAAPASASADTTYCVPSAAIAGCPAGGVAEPTIGAALTAVNADAGAHDVVRIGPGTFSEGNLDDAQGHRVDIVGAGVGATTLAPPSGDGVALSVVEPSSTVSALTIDVAPGASNRGLSVWGASVTDVAINATSASTNAYGIWVNTGGTLTRVQIALPADGTGILGDLGAQPTVQDSTISAGTGVWGSALVERSRIVANVDVEATGWYYPKITVDSSILQAVAGPGPATAVSAPEGTPAPINQIAKVLLRHDTILGDGSAGSMGVDCTSAVPDGTCAVEVGSSIITGFAHAIVRSTDGSGGNAYADVYVDYSDFDPSGDVSTDIAAPTPPLTPGTIDMGAYNLNVPPDFATTDPTSPQAWELTRGSPLIDMGTTFSPALPAGPGPPESTTDFYGRPRIVAGTRGRAAIPDIGATEYQAVAPTITAAASGSSVLVLTPLQFAATASDADPGDAVTITWRFDDGGSAVGAVVAHVFASPGRHTATATATDLDGNVVSASTKVLVTSLGPSLGRFTVAPRRFRVPRLGATIAPLASSGGTVISYTDSRAATATFVVLAPARGVVSGRSCHAPPRNGKPVGKRCVRWVRVGSFTHRDRSGPNAFRFTGRIAGRALKPGAYRLDLSARDSRGTSAVLQSSFAIRG